MNQSLSLTLVPAPHLRVYSLAPFPLCGEKCGQRSLCPRETPG
jgi:hypothetical protein